MEDDQRTSDVGLFNYANSYHAAADALGTIKLRVTHSEAPRQFLYYHAIELYAKSFLRLSGMTVAEIEAMRHNAARLRDAFVSNGGWLAEEDAEVFALMTPENVIRSRYIATGYFQRASLEALARTCDSIHETVRGALRNAGRSIR